eukprot:6090104-Amphidinium_carterae.1
MVADKQLHILKVGTDSNPAEVLTKSMPADQAASFPPFTGWRVCRQPLVAAHSYWRSRKTTTK